MERANFTVEHFLRKDGKPDLLLGRVKTRSVYSKNLNLLMANVGFKQYDFCWLAGSYNFSSTKAGEIGTVCFSIFMTYFRVQLLVGFVYYK